MTIKEVIETLKSQPIFTDLLAPAPHGGYICIAEGCGNGTGKGGTGANVYGDSKNHLKCHKCGNVFTNLDVIAYHLKKKVDGGKIIGQDFIDVVQFGANYLHLPLDESRSYDKFKAKGVKRPAPPITSAPQIKTDDAEEIERAQKLSEMIRADIASAQGNLNNLPENARRGLTLETLKHFGCGYLEKWQSPAAILDGKKTPFTRRLIVPTSERHYLASAIDRDAVKKQYHKMHAGSKEVFNAQSISVENINIIVEGEIDAMSIWQVTSGAIPVIALGGAAEKKWIDSAPESAKFLILFDNDDAGKKKSAQLRDELIKRGYPAVVAFLSDGDTKIDANNILCADDGNGAAMLADKINALVNESQPDLEKIAAEIRERQEFEQRVEDWVAENGDIEPATLEKVKDSAEYLASLTEDKITATLVGESKTLRAVAICRYYDFFRGPAEDFLARVYRIRRMANEMIKQETPENPVSDKIRAIAQIETLCNLNKKIERFTSEIKTAHTIFKDQLELEKAMQLDAERRAQREEIAQEKILLLEELKACPPSPERNAEMRSTIARLCEWKCDRLGNPISVRANTHNYELIFTYDPLLDGLIGYDEMQATLVLLKQPPWKDEFIPLEEWTDADDAAARVYLRVNYPDIGTRQLYEDYISVSAHKRKFHPVKEFLAKLPNWDGVERAEKLFIDYLKVKDSPYAREVTLLFLFGALARIYKPGCEFHYVPILLGAQGIGKSGILKMLGGQWHSVLADSVEDPHAIDAIQRGWIMEVEEFWAGSKASNEALKSFFARDAETHRFAYERRARKVPRHCVFAITTNQRELLKDATGNRRYPILECKAQRGDSSAIKSLTEEIVAQIWAEALYKFRQKFPTDEDIKAASLELSTEARLEVEALAQEHSIDDSVAAEAAGFLEKKIPHKQIWDNATKEEHREYIKRGYLELDAEEVDYRLRDIPTFDRDKILKTATPIQITTRAGTVTSKWRFRGVRYRMETCAAEIANECFGTDARKMSHRINEALAEQIDGWKLKTDETGKAVRQKNFAGIYGDQKKVYVRVGKPPEDEFNALATDEEDVAFDESQTEEADVPF